MNADAFRHLYDYHFAQNRKIWNDYVAPLTQLQFTQKVGYSHGSVREQIVHLMSVDDAWFRDLSGVASPELTPADTGDRTIIRAYGDRVEQHVREYLKNLRDDMLLLHPFTEGEDKALVLWQILIHVVNHGTDHRAQLLRVLNDLGVKTEYQDYIFYAYAHP